MAQLIYRCGEIVRTCTCPEDAATMAVYDNCPNEDVDFYSVQAELTKTHGDLFGLFSGLRPGDSVAVGVVTVSAVDEQSLYEYFCGCCGQRFRHALPERGENGSLNDIPCPKCGAWEVYQDTPEGARASREASSEHEAKLISWEEVEV